MKASGYAHAALGFVNAIGSGGYGAAAALDLEFRVEVWYCDKPRGYTLTRGVTVEISPEILAAVARTVSDYTGTTIEPLCAQGYTSTPLEAGLKGSSALINALLEAALALAGVEKPGLLAFARLGVKAARLAGLTVTGALDDHLAVSGCGGYATDNTSQSLVVHKPDLEAQVVVAVPGRRSIKTIDPQAFRDYKPLYETAWRLAVQGDWLQAATLNGVATMLATNIDPKPLLGLVTQGLATAVGVSGKGPAVYAIPGDNSSETLAALTSELSRITRTDTIVTAKITPCRH